MKLRELGRNKVVAYLTTRYITYVIQFGTSIVIAVKLGPHYLGIWGFLLLLINSFQVTNFGIASSLSILLVQNKDDDRRVRGIVKTGFVLIGALCIAVLAIAICYHYSDISLFDKYEIGNLFYAVCVIAMLAYVNRLMSSIYRARNGLFEVAFQQSIIPFLLLVAVVAARERVFIVLGLACYAVGHGVALIVFLRGSRLPRGGVYSWMEARSIAMRSMYLFSYNLCFYLIIISTKAIISIYYTVEEYGYFTFGYTVAHAVLLLVETISFVVFPKILQKLSTRDMDQTRRAIETIRANVVSLSHGLVYMVLAMLPIVLDVIPRYRDTLTTVNLICLALLLYTNTFGYNAYLMAQNRERAMAAISCVCLMINIGVGLILVSVVGVGYEYVIVASMMAYAVFAILCVYVGEGMLRQSRTLVGMIQGVFPIRLLLPYGSAAVMVGKVGHVGFLPLVFFLLLNVKTMRRIVDTTKRLFGKPDIIDIDLGGGMR